MADASPPSQETPASFTNWARTFSCSPSAVVTAADEAAVLAAVAAARAAARRIRVVGAGHSPSDIACTNDVMLNIDRLCKVIHVDLENRQVTVEAGIRIKAINELLDRLGLALPNLGSISDQSIAGAIATGTHGTGIDHGIIATSIVQLRLVTSSGEIRTLSRKSDPDVFLAALCSLGCLGVITQVTIQAVPAFLIRADQSALSFSDMIQNWESLVHSADHVRFWWFPHTEHCIVWKGTRITDPPSSSSSPSTPSSSPASSSPPSLPPSPPPSWLRETFLKVHLYEFSLFISTIIPSIVPTINQHYFQSFFSTPTTTIDKSYKAFNFDCLFSQYVTEWAVDWRDAPKALDRLKSFLSHDKNHVIAHSPIEIRFVRRDDIILSGAYGRDTCYIGIIMYRPYGRDVVKHDYWSVFEGIMMALGGRPHWAKSHPLRPNQLRQRYPLFEAFCSIRKSIDPYDMFVNDYIQRHILDDRDVGSGDRSVHPKL